MLQLRNKEFYSVFLWIEFLCHWASVSGTFSGRFAVDLNPDHVRFYFSPYVRKPSLEQEIVYQDAASLDRAGLISGRTVHLLIHGFTDNHTLGVFQRTKNAYIQRRIPNLISVDWGKLASFQSPLIPPDSVLQNLYYPFALRATKIVGRRIAKFLEFLRIHGYLKSYDDVHLIGHSLGAHVAGVTGYWTQRYTESSVGRITGLDPAGPFYNLLPPSTYFKLSEKRARFVEVLHTDSDVLGTRESLGHVDYFVNDGRAIGQRQCDLTDLEELSCAHKAAALSYFRRAVLGEAFFGCPCARKSFNLKKPPCFKPTQCGKTARFNTVVPPGEMKMKGLNLNVYGMLDYPGTGLNNLPVKSICSI